MIDIAPTGVGWLAFGEFEVAHAQGRELPEANTGLRKQLDDGSVAAMVAAHAQEPAILRLG